MKKFKMACPILSLFILTIFFSVCEKTPTSTEQRPYIAQPNELLVGRWHTKYVESGSQYVEVWYRFSLDSLFYEFRESLDSTFATKMDTASWMGKYQATTDSLFVNLYLRQGSFIDYSQRDTSRLKYSLGGNILLINNQMSLQKI